MSQSFGCPTHHQKNDQTRVEGALQTLLQIKLFLGPNTHYDFSSTSQSKIIKGTFLTPEAQNCCRINDANFNLIPQGSSHDKLCVTTRGGQVAESRNRYCNVIPARYPTKDLRLPATVHCMTSRSRTWSNTVSKNVLAGNRYKTFLHVWLVSLCVCLHIYGCPSCVWNTALCWRECYTVCSTDLYILKAIKSMAFFFVSILGLKIAKPKI